MGEWRRSGECCRCGDCCRGDPRRDTAIMRRAPEQPGFCPALSITGGVASCLGHGHDPYYLSGCNIWPTHPQQIAHLPRCTYRFEWHGD